MKKNTLKSILILFLFIGVQLHAQIGAFQVRRVNANDRAIMLGYHDYRHLDFGIGSASPNNGAFSIEHWDGGLNFWVPWPSANNGNYKMFLNEHGMLGVNMKPMGKNYTNGWGQNMNQWLAKLWVNGRCASDGYYTWSDSTVKGFVSKMENNLQNVLKLNPVSYKYKSKKFGDNVEPNSEILTEDETKQATINAEKSKILPEYEEVSHFGFIAQELKRVCPTVVADLGGIEGVNLPEMLPLLVGAIQDQQKIIDTQSVKIEQLRQEIQELKGKTVYTDVDKTKLYQNNPNPFKGLTIITYFIDENVSVTNAVIEIRNIMGVLHSTLTLNDKSGLGKVEFNSEGLNDGYYVYTLKVNGNVKDSKMMLIGDN